MIWLDLIFYVAVTAGSISGSLVAIETGFDLVGVVFLSAITGLGGGIVRDLILGSTPPFAIVEYKFLITAVVAAIGFYFLRKRIRNISNFIVIFDAIGMGPLLIFGMQKAELYGLSNLSVLTIGLVTTIFGGISRDVLANRIPFVFQKEIYILPCLAGELVFLFFRGLIPTIYLDIIVSVLVFGIRIIAYYRNWHLRSFYDY